MLLNNSVTHNATAANNSAMARNSQSPVTEHNFGGAARQHQNMHLTNNFIM